MTVKKNALVIGCGKMGCLYDRPDQSQIASHAHALSRNGYSICFYDTDQSKSQAAAKIWNSNYTKNLTDQKYDVAVLASPTEFHHNVLKKLDPSTFHTLVIEKPFCANPTQALEIIELFSEKTIFVNYSRLYIKEIRNLALRIQDLEFGKLTNFSGLYSRGFLNNGSHLLSLLHFLVNISDFKFSRTRMDKEKKSGLINCDVHFEFDNSCRGQLMAIDEELYPIWELNLYFEKAVITISDFKIRLDLPIANPPQHPLEIPIDYNNALMGLYEKISNHDKSFALMTIQNAIWVHKTIEKIMRKI